MEFIFFLLFLSTLFSSPLIDKVYHSPKNSRFFNQTIVIYNSTDKDIPLDDFYLKVSEQTNQFQLWNNLFDLSSYDIKSDFLLKAGENIIILDRGYKGEEVFSLKEANVLTVEKNSFGNSSFLKSGNKIELVNKKNNQIVDYFHLREAPTEYLLRRINRNLKGNLNNLAIEKINNLTNKNSISDNYFFNQKGEKLRLKIFDNSSKINIGEPITAAIQFWDNKIFYANNEKLSFEKANNVSAYNLSGKSINEIQFYAGTSEVFQCVFLSKEKFPFYFKEKNFSYQQINFNNNNNKQLQISEIHYQKSNPSLKIKLKNSINGIIKLYLWNEKFLSKKEFLFNIHWDKKSNENSILLSKVKNNSQNFVNENFQLNKKQVISIYYNDVFQEAIFYQTDWFSKEDKIKLSRIDFDKIAYDKRNWQLIDKQEILIKVTPLKINSVNFSILSLSVQQMKDKILAVNIFDKQANLIYKDELKIENNQQILNINLKNKVRRGIYFITFSNKDLPKIIRYRFFVEY